MEQAESQTYTAFEGAKLIASGPLEKVVLKVKARSSDKSSTMILVFSDSTGKQIDFDLRGTEQDVLKRLQVFVTPANPITQQGPGRPKLGVISREISLLPRHWEWLSTQTGGASVTIRALVDEAKKQSSGKESIKKIQERTYTFMSAIAGNLENFEEASRALFAKNKRNFDLHISSWPKDIKNHLSKLTHPLFEK